MKKFFVLCLFFVPLSLFSNPSPVFIIDEFQVTPDSLERIELRFNTNYFPWGSSSLYGWTVTTNTGIATIDSPIIVQKDSTYGYIPIMLGHSNLTSPFSLNDTLDSIIITIYGYDYRELLFYSPRPKVNIYGCWDTIPTPPSNTSMSLYEQVVGYCRDMLEPIVYADWYIDSTPTFGLPNNDYPGGGCRISGRIFSKDSIPMKGIPLYAQNKYDFPSDTSLGGTRYDTFYYSYTTLSDTNGNYLFDSVVVQPYKISVVSPFYTADTVFGFTSVMCSVESLNIYLHQTAIQENSPFSLTSFRIYPTPIRKYGNIEFSILKPVFVEVSIYNISGSLINTILNENKSPGKYKLKWDTRDKNNAIVPKGVYFCRLKAGNNIFTKKLILM